MIFSFPTESVNCLPTLKINGICVRVWWLLLLPTQTWYHLRWIQVAAHFTQCCQGFAVTSNSTCSCPLCTCVNATSKAIKQAPVPRVSPACLDMTDESQSLYYFPPWDTEILSSCFSHSCLTRRLFFSSWTQWGFIGLKVLSLKMPKWIPNVQILEDIKGESHTWIGNTLFGLSTEDFLAIFHTFMQIKKEFMTGIMMLSFLFTWKL